MSVVELLPPISPEVITRDRAPDDLNGVHLWSTFDPERRALCGAGFAEHSCPETILPAPAQSTVACPHCGQPICAYCRLLAS